MTINNTDIVISSRVRLARNIQNLPFGKAFNKLHADNVALEFYRSLGGDKSGFGLYKPTNQDSLDGAVLKEKRLISADLLLNAPLASVVLSDDETVSIMIGEEDHLRLQCILPGLNLQECFSIADEIDNVVAKNMPIAFDDKLGFLTACPTNLGTGLRASAMMFLPALTIYNSLQQCVQAMSLLNMAVRGVYGEGSDTSGYLYQLSNQRTLGASEHDILEAVEQSVQKVSFAEKQARDILLQEGGSAFKDKIYRAYGTLLHAYKIESSEFMQTMALVKLGVYYGYFKLSDTERFEKLLIEAQPATLQSISSITLSQQDRDVFRAKYVASVLKKILSV